jgi:carboxypeptidase PM20D1
MLRKILLFFLLLFCLLAGIVLFNTFTFKSMQETLAPAPAIAVPDSAVAHFRQAIRFKTISYTDSTRFDSSQFMGFQRFLQKTYPLVHQQLNREVINSYSLLYIWQGKNPALKPVIFMGHQDVVPIEEETRKEWKTDPFSGELKDNYIWGRGTVDDKINVIALLEAAEKRLAQNFQPERTVYFVFGHDEEISGLKGALPIARLLESRGVKAEFVLDEGGIITRERIPGMQGKSVALVGTSEKGYLSVELSVNMAGGHSSMPEKETSIDVLSRALIKLREHPFKAQFSPSTLDFMQNVGPELPFMQKMAFANRWLFEPLIVSIYEKSGAGNATIRTTIAPTILQSGIKDNVIPAVAKATVNFRILPGTTSAAVLAYAEKTIADERIKITTVGLVSEPSAVSSSQTDDYKKIIRHIRQNLPGTLTSPFLMIGATDSRHFKNISENIFKFSPMIDPIGFHGINERLDVGSYERCIGFYYELLGDLR